MLLESANSPLRVVSKALRSSCVRWVCAMAAALGMHWDVLGCLEMHLDALGIRMRRGPLM